MTDQQLPDFTRWTPIDAIPDGGMQATLVDGQAILVCRNGDALHAIGANCPHQGAPLAEGLLVDGVIYCPWHHARFDCATGASLCAPAFDALPRYTVDRRGDTFSITGSSPTSEKPPRKRISGEPMVIVGGGAAGFAAADALRREGWEGEITLFSDDPSQPYDRTALTKDYLDGSVSDDQMAIARHDLASLGVKFDALRVERIDAASKKIALSDGRRVTYGKLLLATGASPVRPELPGVDMPHVTFLRSLDDCKRILSRTKSAHRVAVIGGSFIAMEAAASLRSHKLDVEVIAPEPRPMEKNFGPEISDLIVATHREKGVKLNLGVKVARIKSNSVVLENNVRIEADLVIIGAGVAPRLELAKAAGLAVDRGLTVNSRLRTSAPDIYAAGDIARWPDPISGERIRVEHWVVAEKQGQTAAANMLGADRSFDAAPFFWTKHFDLAIHYSGHAESWDELVVDGDIQKRDATVRFQKGGRTLAIATIGRDRGSVAAELELEGRGVRT